MKDYIFFDDNEFLTFKAENAEKARNFVINYCDISFNPNFIEVFELIQKDNEVIKFNVQGEPRALGLEKFFTLSSVGDGAFCFFNQNNQPALLT